MWAMAPTIDHNPGPASPSLSIVKSYGVTVVGHDRPGIVADVTGALAELGGNIEDSSMTLLRGHFAWTLIVALDADSVDVDAVLDPLRAADLKLAAVELSSEVDSIRPATHWLSVHGSDRPGIVSAVTRELALVGGNITDLSTRLAGSLYIVLADVYLPPTADEAFLGDRLAHIATELGVDVTLRVADEDDVL